MKFFTLLFISSLVVLATQAQTVENQGWLFITHRQKLAQKFDLLGDVQLRSANKFDYLTTLLLRGALRYNINKKHSVALGYAYKADWEHQSPVNIHSHENRIYQQFLYNFKYHKTELSLRARLEQRWVKEEQTNFSQRARAFISAQIPLFTDTAFTYGFYTALQNEIFINVLHRQNVNGKTFDQNRTFGSLGYRWSKQIDTEVGYQFWYQKEAENSYRRNIIQLMITTNF